MSVTRTALARRARQPAVVVAILGLTPGCAGPGAAPASSPDAAMVARDDEALREFVRAFNYWSDRGLYLRQDLAPKAASGNGELAMPDMLGDGRELEKLLSPRCRVQVEIEGKRESQSSAEYVNLIQRNRFMWKVREGLLDGPHFTVRGSQTLVKMAKSYLEPDRAGSTYVQDCHLTVEREDERFVATEIRAEYRKASEEEAARIASLPPFERPSTTRGARILTTEEDFKKSVETVPPRPADPVEIRALIQTLEAVSTRGRGDRALAAFQLGTFGPGAAAAVPALMKALGDKEWCLRRAAAEALGNMGPPARVAVPALEKLLADESGDVRYHARWALDRLAGQPAAPAKEDVHFARPSSAEVPTFAAPEVSLRVATFDIDATPPVGSFLAYDPAIGRWELGLRARGIVLIGAGEPVVLCAIDWIGIANESHDVFRSSLAKAAGTTPVRVAVHALHQHDAPDSDFSAEQILKDARVDPRQYEGTYQRQLLAELAAAVHDAVGKAQPVSHLGLGSAEVKEVASNRRVLGPDGKVRAVRYTACGDPQLRAEPEGTIDPVVSLVSFWNGNQPVAVLSYFATHPQSYYRTGLPNPDFPGLARFLRQLAVPAALHVHFNGAGGNIGAGKYNDGSPGNRLVLAERLADGMRRAWESARREPITPESVGWAVEPVVLPAAKHLAIPEFEALVQAKDPSLTLKGSASRMAWLRRAQSGRPIDVMCLTLGRARILHMPGELFVEYQLAAKSLRPDLFVCMAAYADYGPWYIGTAVAYEQGGYETGPTASNVAPEVEAVLMGAIRKLLGGKP